jgi:hypothetical protein
MTAKSDELIAELVSACVAFGREKEPDWQTRIETARQELKAYVAELEAAQRWKATRLEWHDVVSRAIKSEYYEPTAESTETGERAGDSEGSEG